MIGKQISDLTLEELREIVDECTIAAARVITAGEPGVKAHRLRMAAAIARAYAGLPEPSAVEEVSKIFGIPIIVLDSMPGDALGLTGGGKTLVIDLPTVRAGDRLDDLQGIHENGGI